MAERPPTGRDLAAMRAEIDAIDHALIELVARRRALVAEMFEDKRRRGAALIDPDRERAILADRSASAERLGVPADIAERIFRAILDGSHAQADDPGG
jgi:chorismate mutase/prephenate dehydrogenase